MESKKLEKPCENATFQALQGVMKPDEETGGVFPTAEKAIQCGLIFPIRRRRKLWRGSGGLGMPFVPCMGLTETAGGME